MNQQPNRMSRWMFRITIFMMVLTGFAQMPIFKRYYIADIPGLGWLDQFYVTLYLHYLFGVVLVGLLVYRITASLLAPWEGRRLAGLEITRVIFLFVLILSGILLWIRNFPGYVYSQKLVIFLDLSHIGFTLLLLGISGWMGIRKPNREEFKGVSDLFTKEPKV
jgi:cytochrome b subunit of formate dehydrogenase